MNSDQRWLVGKFIDELKTIKLGEIPPLHTTDRRLQFVEMVLTEIGDDDPEQLAWRATASAVQDLCFEPTNPAVIAQFKAVLNAHAELLRATFPGLD